MRLHRKMRVWAAVLALILAWAVPAQAAGYRAIVTAGSMRVYADAGCAWAIGTLPVTTVVTVEAQSGGTALISLGGARGYASASDMVALDDLAQPVTFNTDSRIYRAPDLSSEWMAIPAGFSCNLLATNGSWAMVENAGIVAYTNRDHLGGRGEVQQPQAPAQDSAPQVVVETFEARVTAQMMFIFESASATAPLIGGLPAGQVVNVHAYNSEGWALIELSGHYGFARISDMTRDLDAPSEPSAPEQPDDYLTSGEYSVEQTIFLFLTREMDLNTAVACGILANVERECSFKVTNQSNDGGYGICQWTGVRNTRLKNWCRDNGYDHSTLEGQLWYLKYELENHHPKTLRYLRGVENSADGAYDAAYYFCYNFEIPAKRATRSVERGNIARDKYWERYAV